MSHRVGPHHKMWTSGVMTSRPPTIGQRTSGGRSEAGYTLVALLALMTVLALFALAAAPSIRQQAQREREIETIFRGEEVADAIRDYYKFRSAQGARYDQALPTSIDQLLEGIPIPGGTRKRQILRASAAHDPLSASGEWRFVRPRAQRLVEFQRDVMAYVDSLPPTPKDSQIADLQRVMVPTITNVLNTGSDETATGEQEDSSSDSTGPFVGVASGSRSKAILYYYGIDRHDGWIFTPLFR
jgi:type II secretory pathway pseudopilin PulG